MLCEMFQHYCCEGIVLKTSNTNLASQRQNNSLNDEALHTMGWNSFMRFNNACGIVDEVCTTLVLDKIFSDSSDKNSVFLRRHNFMEALVRIAIQKSSEKIPRKRPPSALAFLMQFHILPNTPKAMSVVQDQRQMWRKTTFYREGIEDVLQDFMGELHAAFEGHMAEIPGGDGKMGLSMKSFFDIMNGQDVLRHVLVDEKAIKTVFRASKMSVIDEGITSKLHYYMTFFDFLEAVCRLSEVVDQSKIDVQGKVENFIRQFFIDTKRGRAVSISGWSSALDLLGGSRSRANSTNTQTLDSPRPKAKKAMAVPLADVDVFKQTFLID